MVFIEGVGYVNDSSAVATPNRTQSVSETTPNFVGMLRTETVKLSRHLSQRTLIPSSRSR